MITFVILVEILNYYYYYPIRKRIFSIKLIFTSRIKKKFFFVASKAINTILGVYPILLPIVFITRAIASFNNNRLISGDSNGKRISRFSL